MNDEYKRLKKLYPKGITKRIRFWNGYKWGKYITAFYFGHDNLNRFIL